MTAAAAIIAVVENKWLEKLYENCRAEFKPTKLASHDHEHHLRVWQYAKQIFLELESAGFKLSENLIEKTMVAVFFHDLGLTVTPDEVGHGLASRKMCEQFFRKNHLPAIDGFKEVLEVIAKHDDKQSSAKAKDSLMAILNTADDLDAFGAVGVLRYAEIYLLRDPNMITLPERVIINLDTRFTNFVKVYGELKALVKNQKRRYLYARKFYLDLQIELSVTSSK